MNHVAVIGAGTMGHGIAYVTTVAGYEVTLTDVDEDTLERARAHVGLALDSGVMRGKVTEDMRREAMNRLTLSTSLDDAVRHASVVIESAPENVTLKQDIFRRVCNMAPHHALLATNTSSLSVSDIASATNCAERVVGMHFFNPGAAMKLVEVIRGEKTSDATADSARAHAACRSAARPSSRARRRRLSANMPWTNEKRVRPT
jgi:3-hydroxybutyryl-CoA dehydrogenase